MSASLTRKRSILPTAMIAFARPCSAFSCSTMGWGLTLLAESSSADRSRRICNGTDFVPNFLAMTQHRLRVYLVGTTDAIVEKAAQRFRARYPRHMIVGWRNGFFADLQDIEETCRNIRAARADCVLVGMGNPQQELWIDEHGHKTGVRLLFGVGALFDFEAGVVRRAPLWVRRLRCEWVYRLLQEPGRLARRYLIGNFLLLGRVLADAWR